MIPLLALFLGAISLDEAMTPQEKKTTGVDSLNYTEKKALESWIDRHFEAKDTFTQKTLSLSLNIGDGKMLELSDGSIYEVDPDQRIYSSLWITPFRIDLSRSNDPDYPVRITNLQTGTSVNARKLSDQEKQAVQEKKGAPQPAKPETDKKKPKEDTKKDTKKK